MLRDLDPGPLLVVGGRSAGARVACRTASAVGRARARPLLPPGTRRGVRSAPRADELARPAADGLEVHVVQGRTDPFGTPAELRAVLPPRGTLAEVDGPHSLERSAPAVAAAAVAVLASLTS